MHLSIKEAINEKAVIKHAANTKDKKALKSLRTITEDDIVTENLLKTQAFT